MKFEIEKQMEIEVEQMPLLLESCIDHYLKTVEFRCYMRPAKINGHPPGYGGAQTFKIVKIERRKRK
jgi:hypothetical protein